MRSTVTEIVGGASILLGAPALLIDDAGGMDVGLAFVNPARVVVRAEDEERARAVLVDAGMSEE